MILSLETSRITYCEFFFTNETSMAVLCTAVLIAIGRDYFLY